ncbi:hypothetical protein AB9T38_05910 [Campylobacter hepaticus]
MKVNVEENIAFLQNLINEAEGGYEVYKESFKALQNSYVLESTDLKSLHKRNKSSLYIPKINAKVKHVISSLNDVYFNSERMADIEGYINSDQKIIELWQKALDFYSNHLNLFKIFQGIFLDAILIGTSVAKVVWHKGAPRIEKVDIDSVYFDPNAILSDDISYIINKIYLNFHEIEKRMHNGIYKKENIKDFFDKNNPYKKFLIYDIYQKDKEDNWSVSTLFESILLRFEVFLEDGQPFIWGSMMPSLKRIEKEGFVCAYGESIMASALNLQNEINLTRNILMDSVRTHVNPKLILPKSAGISREDLETVGKPLYAEEPRAVQVLPQPNISSAVGHLQLLETELTEVTGISPQNNGAQAVKNETATEISIKAQEGGRRVADYIRQFNETFMEPLFDRFAKLVYKYGDNVFFDGFDREDMPSFRFKIQTATGTMNKEVRRAALNSSMQVLSAIYQMHMSLGDMNGAYNILESCKNIGKEIMNISGIKNANELLDSKNNMGQVMQNQALKQESPMYQNVDEEAVKRLIMENLINAN